MKAKKRTALLGRVYLIICLIVALFPIYWMINTSFKSDSEIYAKVPTLIPHHPTGAAYSYLINNTNFLSSMKNSLIIAVSVSVFSILIAYPVAYTLSRLKFKGRRIFSKSVLFMYLLPTTVLYIPLYMLVSKMHLTNTIWGLIVIYPTFTLPYVAWILIPHIAAVPKELEEARYELRNRLHEKCGKFVNVQILADLLDVRDERWHNAIEGYLGNNKLLLVVEPKYAKIAMEIYQDMDKKKFFRAAVLDTEKVQETEWEVKEGALAKELIAKEPYVQAYINFFLGNVIKCESIEELRQNRIGITADCVLYHSFRLQHINPENYTRRAYIGETSMRQRIRRLEEKCESLQEERIPLQEMLEEIRRISQLEGLTQPLEDYRQWLSDLQKIPAKEAEKARLLDTMQKLREESVLVWEQQKQEIQQKQEAKKAEIEAVQKTIWNHQENGKRFQNMQVDFNEQLVQKENEFRQQDREKYEPEFQEYLEGRQSRNYEYLMRERIKKKQPLEDAQEKAYEKLVEARSAYLRKYPNRTYSATIRDNDVYEKQLSNLECDNLEKYREEAQEQARAAVEHFKVDFVSKIRYAIKEAYQKKDELNRIISRLDFGKDKYQFVITKNKGPDGRFYRMFMDDALDINPSQLSDHMENQMNLFTMEHEEEYGDLMNELIEIFIPPENATREELEEARKNMDKYADYRTYLSFDMQQIVQGEKGYADRSEQDDQEKFRWRRSEPTLHRASGKLCTDLQNQSVSEDQASANPASGCPG